MLVPSRAILSGVTALAIAAFASQAKSDEMTDQLEALADARISEMLADPMVVAAIRRQNETSIGLSEAEILSLDNTWRAELNQTSAPMIDDLLTRELSVSLRRLQDDSAGLFTEIFVMDAAGLNVASTGRTSDLWQGDEAKWQKTYLEGPGARHISEIEFDESTQSYQAQLSVAITDPETGKAIGAATFGVNVDALQ